MRGQFSTLEWNTALRLWFWNLLFQELGHGNEGTARLGRNLAERLWPKRDSESEAA